MNITDVDDKTIRNAREQGRSLADYTEPFIRQFHAGLKMLRIDPADHYPKATDHIPEMVVIIQGLLDKGFAYRKDGSIYFAIDKFPAYGRLSGIKPEDLRTTDRVANRLESDEYEKESARDFALWKAPKEGEPAWDTPLGPGRPGWHIECSAMSAKYLGPTFDIHCGGVDNIFPHHENEIAQSEAFTGRPFVKMWLHCHHLVVDGEKMSKSKGNVISLAQLGAQGVDLAALRYFLISTHYRRGLNFTAEAMDQAASALKRLTDFRFELITRRFPPGRTGAAGDMAAEAKQGFLAGLEDDLNISLALTAVFDLVRKANTLIHDGRLAADDARDLLDALQSMDEVLAVLPQERQQSPLELAIEARIASREAARKAKDLQAGRFDSRRASGRGRRPGRHQGWCAVEDRSDERRRLGRQGEEEAARFLERKGLRIVERGYRALRGEIDIIAWDSETLVFVEVKTRTDPEQGRPEEAVTPAKQAQVRRIATAYLADLGLGSPFCRFDVIAAEARAGRQAPAPPPRRRLLKPSEAVARPQLEAPAGLLHGFGVGPAEVNPIGQVARDQEEAEGMDGPAGLEIEDAVGRDGDFGRARIALAGLQDGRHFGREAAQEDPAPQRRPGRRDVVDGRLPSPRSCPRGWRTSRRPSSPPGGVSPPRARVRECGPCRSWRRCRSACRPGSGRSARRPCSGTRKPRRRRGR